MWLETRQRFREGDDGWAKYQAFIRLPHLREVRSIDTALNRRVEDSGSYPVASFADALDVLRAIPRPTSDREYHLLYLNAETEAWPPDGPTYRLLGYDLSDGTETSSLLNCGPWGGRLAPLAQRLNQNGLLSLDDARLAKRLLPEEWPGEPHAAVAIWALYEVAPTPEANPETRG